MRTPSQAFFAILLLSLIMWSHAGQSLCQETPKCNEGEEYDDIHFWTCYKICEEGWKGYGPYCVSFENSSCFHRLYILNLIYWSLNLLVEGGWKQIPRLWSLLKYFQTCLFISPLYKCFINVITINLFYSSYGYWKLNNAQMMLWGFLISYARWYWMKFHYRVILMWTSSKYPHIHTSTLKPFPCFPILTTQMMTCHPAFFGL